MPEQTDIRDFLPPLTPDMVRAEDKILELGKILDLFRKVHPIWIKRGLIKRTEAASRMVILETILADYEHQVLGKASYEDTAQRLGEKE